MKKVILFVITFTFLLAYPLCAHAEVTAWGYCLIDGHTGRILYEKNAHISHEIASITKIMTAICALENATLNECVTVSANASGTEGSSCWLEIGEKLSMEDMLYGLMLASGNDVAIAIAEHVSGDVASFVALMNETAKKIGAKNTSFKNPHGLDEEGHYSSCYDMAIITRYALSFDDFRKICATQKKTIPWQNKQWDRTLHNHNKFLQMYPDVIGVKTGYTDKAGRTLVTAVEKDDMLLILVTIDAPDDWQDHKTLYDLAFSEYKLCSISCITDLENEISVYCGKQNICTYTVERPFVALMKQGESENLFSFQTTIPKFIKAPIEKGDIIGRIDIFCDGKWIDSRNLMAKSSIAKQSFFEQFKDRLQILVKQVFLFYSSWDGRTLYCDYKNT